MMLSILLEGVALKGVVQVSPDQDCEITSLTIDSREVVEGSLFVALQGAQQHGLDYIENVIENGAAAIIWETSDNAVAQDIFQDLVKDIDIPQFEAHNLRGQLGFIANRFHSYPSQSLNVIGITGTDGKTSVSHFVAQALDNCAVMGTLGIGALSDLQTATHTTPDVLSTHKNLAMMKSEGIESVAMEVSSHALDQRRVAGVNFTVAVLTNLSRDHLDYHGTVEAYAEAKAKLFAWRNLDALVLNLDDEFGKGLAEKWGGDYSVEGKNMIPYGIGSVIDYPKNALVAENAVFDNNGISATIHYRGEQQDLSASVLGRFNLSNLLAAIGAMLSVGQTLEESVILLGEVGTVAGRMEKVSDTEILTVVDYAHTPNALETVLKALREHTENKLICVFGCGGDRDSGKRPLMAGIAEANADIVIATDDNPRTEDPESIMQDIVAGFTRPDQVIIEHNRAEAISIALQQANPGDTVLIAGKGHENEQILASGTIPFNDKEQAQDVLEKLRDGSLVSMDSDVKSEVTSTIENTVAKNDFLSLAEICQKVGGRLINVEDDQQQIDSVATDSRLVEADQLFVAIIGERFDAHDFVADLEGKAGAALVSKEIDCDLPQIVVDDTLQALADLATAWRKEFTKPLIALTGSNGKTTLKEMIAAILAQEGKVLSTFGNLNNNIGMPLTLLRLRDEHDYAVIEMGANHFGEIDFLTKIAQPDVAVLNNAGAAHLEGFIDLDGVSRAKGEIFIGLGTQGTAVINADDVYADYWKGLNTNREVMAFGMENDANISGRISSNGDLMISDGDVEIRANLQLLGRHNAMNALAAAAATTALGIELGTIVKGLKTMLPVKGRLAPVAGINNSQILDDTYNANPDSVAAALEVLAQRENTVFVLGDLGELGENPEKVHEKIGEEAKAVGINHLYCLGDHSAKACDSFGTHGQSFEDMDDLLNTLKKDVNENLPENVSILVKGSRFMKMERVVEALSISDEYGESH